MHSGKSGCDGSNWAVSWTLGLSESYESGVVLGLRVKGHRECRATSFAISTRWVVLILILGGGEALSVEAASDVIGPVFDLCKLGESVSRLHVVRFVKDPGLAQVGCIRFEEG